MRGRQRRRIGPPPASRDRWIIPYADFVTLLFSFFTALYAVTAVDASRLPQLTEGVTAAVGDRTADRPPATGDGVLPQHTALVGPDDAKERAARQRALRDRLERELAEDLQARHLELVEDRRGVALAIPEAFSFPAGSADLSPHAQALMVRVGTVLSELPNAVRVEGHTDNAPIHTPRFTSNFELSTSRATEVIRFLIERAHVPGGRLSAAGYSEFHPRASNDTVAGRTMNRRVDIVILNAETAATEEP